MSDRWHGGKRSAASGCGWLGALVKLGVCAVVASGAVRAAETVPEGVGLVLGGGGARGAAHIGVLKVLEREHIPISHIAGTSVGSFIGALYAVGYSADEIEKIILAIDWKDMFNDDPARAQLPMRRKDEDLRYLLKYKLGIRAGRLTFPRGVLQGQKLLLLLERLTLPVWQVAQFDQLPIPFRCIGTDIGNGEVVVFADGSLPMAVRASMGVPAAYAPIRIRGRLMVDGGIVNNVPVDVVQAMGAEHLIAVNVGDTLAKEAELTSPLSVSNQMLNILMKERTDSILAKMRPDDLLITPDMSGINAAGFEQLAEGIRRGEQAAQRMVAGLRQFAVSAARYAEIRRTQQRPRFDPAPVAFVDVVNTRSGSPHLVADALSKLVGQPLDPLAIETGLATAYGQGRYERITWKPEHRGDATGVRVTPVDKGWGPNFLTFGLQLSDDFAGRSSYQLAAEATFAGTDQHDGETRLRLDLGRLAGLRAERYQPFAHRGRLYLLPFLDYQVENQPLRSNADAEYRLRTATAGLLLGYNLSSNWRVETGLVRGDGKAGVLIGADAPDQHSDFGAFRFGLSHDSLDDSDFPASGGRSDLTLEADRKFLGSDGNGEVLRWRVDQVVGGERNRWLLGVRGHTRFGKSDPLQSLDALGGLGQLSGFIERERIGEHSALARAVYYRRFNDASKLFSLPAYFGASIEAGNVWDRRQDISIESLILAGSVFLGLETPFGPLFLGFGQADTGDNSFYLSFGSLLGGQR